MIVKVERYIEKFSYILVDNVREVFRSDGWKPEPLRINDIIIEDCKEYGKGDLIITENYPCKIKLECIRGDGSEINIVFDTVAYILNDQGKTIEKVLANERM